jgi:starch phosphorylase
MLNGAVTLGTLDGANVEMLDQAGEDNIFIFGAHAEEIAKMEAAGTYRPMELFEKNQDIHKAVSRLVDGTLPVDNKEQFRDIYNSLLTGDYDRADKYFVLYDFDAYDRAFAQVMAAYADTEGWVRKAAANTASAGYFSSDRTIAEYNRQIWGLEPV